MPNIKNKFRIFILRRFNFALNINIILILILHGLAINMFSQSDITAWGNLRGIRIDGELMKFETSLRIIKKDWLDVYKTAKEEQNPSFSRLGLTAKVTSKLDNLSFIETVKDSSEGIVNINYEITPDSNITMLGAYFCIELPNDEYLNPKIDFISQVEKTADNLSGIDNHPVRERFIPPPVTAKGIEINTNNRHLKVITNRLTEILVQKPNPFFGGNLEVYFTIISGNVIYGHKAEANYNIKISGSIDKEPAILSLDTLHPGREFDGIGGNFRLQKPDIDPAVIDYCLKNLNITWGRVEMPWFNWQRDESIDPIEAAISGNLSPRVNNAMEMTQKLAKKNIPIILSAWYPPAWAVTGDIGFRVRKPGEPRGNPLNPMKMRSIVKSIGSYLIYLKEKYGVEPALFSFNESDLGINIRQTGKEHAELIKQLGKYFASKGINTRLLLGDNSDATTYGFVDDALNDPETHQYIGAVSFHSWRGCNNWTLSIWADIAKELNVPLIVAEGSNDAGAWRYPEIFLEPSYALDEIDLYIRILSICQPKSILQWQLTADYSILTGGGIYDTEGPLKPTQRFWNLKQLGLTPKGSFYLPITCSRKDIDCAAFGDIKNGVYTINLVNNGAERKVTLSGLPENIKKLNMYITSKNHEMEKINTIDIDDGTAEFILNSESFITLINYTNQTN